MLVWYNYKVKVVVIIPEVVEVQVQVDGLQKLIGCQIHSVSIHEGGEKIIKSKQFEEAVESSRIFQIMRIGKYIVFTLIKAKNESGDDEYVYMLVHLGMTGGFYLHKPNDHTRVTFKVDEYALNYWDIRKFGSIKAFNADELVRYISSKKLGVDALNSSKFEIEMALVDKFYGNNKNLKTLLLNQTIISGLGNIYANEALFRSGLHPELIPSEISLDDIKCLASQIKEVVIESYEAGGSSIKDYRNVLGEKGSYQEQHMVYGRKGYPCKTCGTTIEKISIEGRSTFYCPSCQGGI